MSGDATREILIAAAILLNGRDEMLVVRKRGTGQFMQPGGKIDAGETPAQALCRELSEEIALDMDPGAFSYHGVHEAEAAHEPGAMVVAHAFVGHWDGDVRPAAEIAEARWLPVAGPHGDIALARLTEETMLPLARAALAGHAEAV